MADTNLVDRLAQLPGFDGVPRGELEWLAENGRLQIFEADELIAAKSDRIEDLWIILSGSMPVVRNFGSGPRTVVEWVPGDVTGRLPYSRMTNSTVDIRIHTRSEGLVIHESRFPDMVSRCPVFTEYTVHSMIDRARTFRSSELQDEKLTSLGKLAAGLAHELNNPASAALRGSKQLAKQLADADSAARELGAVRLSGESLQALDEVLATCLLSSRGAPLSPLEQADREDDIVEWLVAHAIDPVHAEPLAATAVTPADLERLSASLPGDVLGLAVRWIASRSTAQLLTADIEEASARVSDLVAAVKRFTYMDQRGATERCDVAGGLRDTATLVAAKAGAKKADVTLDIEPDLSPVHAVGGELNQVWMALVDNALDAVAEGGRVVLRARNERDRVVVTVIDDGHGISETDLPRVFDPFFTTKPQGEGVGLGLDVARRLIRQHQGAIGAVSRPGRTEFRVELPAAAST